MVYRHYLKSAESPNRLARSTYSEQAGGIYCDQRCTRSSKLRRKSRCPEVVPVGAYARAHWPVRGRCKLRQRPATRCPWPCNWWGWLCVGRVLTTGTQAPCGISACTMQRCADSQQASGLCSYFHSYRYWVWKEHFAVAMT